MRGGRRHSGGQDAAHLCTRLQQAAVSVSAADHARTYGLGHRPVPHLQGREYLHHFLSLQCIVFTYQILNFLMGLLMHCEPEDLLCPPFSYSGNSVSVLVS